MENKKPYKLGLALSGGGTRGFAHVGALKAIEEAGLKPDIIAGVSAGSIAAVLYAAGLTPEQCMDVFRKKSLRQLVEFNISGGGGMFRIDKLKRLIMRTIAPHKTIESLEIPIIVGVTNFETGEWEAMTEGPIADIMMASCSIPVIFKPVRINGHNYVDGGVLCNLPARALRDKCENLLAINLLPAMPSGDIKSVVDVAVRTYNIFSRTNQQPDMDVADLNVEMRGISAYRMFNLKEIERVYNTGYIATRRALRQKGWWHPKDGILPPPD